MNISLPVLSCLFEWKYSHTNWKETPASRLSKASLVKEEAIYFLCKAPNGLGTWTCYSLFKPGKPLATPPELHIVLVQQEESATQHRASSQSNRSPTNHKPWWRLMVVEVSGWNSHSAGTSPSFMDLTPAQSPETVKWETGTEKQMGAIYPCSSHEHLPGKSD